MYMRGPPASIAPVPGIPVPSAPSNSSNGMPGITNHSVRFYELLDALKMEYDLAFQQSSGLIDSANKMSQFEYETKGSKNLDEFLSTFFSTIANKRIDSNAKSNFRT